MLNCSKIIHTSDGPMFPGWFCYISISINVGTIHYLLTSQLIKYLLFKIEHELSTRGATVYFGEPILYNHTCYVLLTLFLISTIILVYYFNYLFIY